MRPILLSLIALCAIGSPLAATALDLEQVVAARETLAREVLVDGVVEARRRATLSAQVGGRVESIEFDVDDTVERGAVVLRIRDTEYRTDRARAAAALDEAVAGFDDAEREFRRSENLRRRKLISEAQYDSAAAALEAARARREVARAALAQAEEQLDRTVLRAPYSGVVVERHVEPGETLVPGQAIISGYAAGELRVSAQVPQSMIGAVREHRRARILSLDGERSIDIDDITIHPFADPQNHAFPVRLDLPGTDSELFPGMLVKVALALGEYQRLLLPRTALVARAEINAVYVIETDGRIAFRLVRPGNRYDDRVEILAGLEPGEAVALDPVAAGIEYKRQRQAPR